MFRYHCKQKLDERNRTDWTFGSMDIMHAGSSISCAFYFPSIGINQKFMRVNWLLSIHPLLRFHRSFSEMWQTIRSLIRYLVYRISSLYPRFSIDSNNRLNRQFLVEESIKKIFEISYKYINYKIIIFPSTYLSLYFYFKELSYHKWSKTRLCIFDSINFI